MFWRKKNKINKVFKCNECGKVHSGWPSLAYSSPTYYHNLSQGEKDINAELDSDFCIVKDSEGTYYFIRAVLNLKVIDSDESLQYGLWVSLSEKNFNDYKENYDNENHETGYFGWLSNDLPNYDNSVHIPSDVITKKGNERPEIIPHQGLEHQFVIDYYQGLTSHEAQRRVDEMLGNKKDI